MEISSKILPQSRRQYDVSLSIQEVTDEYVHAVSHLAADVKLPGFRPGKAPAEMVRDQLDDEKLREEAYSLAVRDAWREVVKTIKETPIEDPAVEIVSFEEGKPSTLKFSFDVRPEITVKNWQTIKLTGLKEKPVLESDLNEVIAALSKGHAKTIVKLTPAKLGDKVEVTFEGYLGNVKQEKLSSKHFPIVLGEHSVIPGFAEALVGVKKSDEKTFELPFPATHFDKTLAGQTVRFEATIDDVFDVIVPTADDEFAKGFGHDRLTQLKAAIKADIAKERAEELFTQQKAKWLAEFEKKVSVELPESLVRAEVGRAKKSWQEFLTSRHLQAEMWLKERNLTMAQLEKDWDKAARTSVTIGLGLTELAAEQKKPLSTNEDYQAFLNLLVKAAILNKK